MEKLPYRRPIIIRRKHRDFTSAFDSDPGGDVHERRDSEKSAGVEHPDMNIEKKEISACEVHNNEQKMSKRKVERSHNDQLESFRAKRFKNNTPELDSVHNISNSRKQKEAREEGECSVETMGDDSEEFDFNDWVEEQKMKIREIHKWLT